MAGGGEEGIVKHQRTAIGREGDMIDKLLLIHHHAIDNHDLLCRTEHVLIEEFLGRRLLLLNDHGLGLSLSLAC